MDIETIKKLMKEGDISQARSRLMEVLSKTPEDPVAQMLYGTCCQLMGDSATFGRIYHDLAPEMAIRVAHGERSERVSLWLKYAAMFAAVFMFGCSSCRAAEYESPMSFRPAVGEAAGNNVSSLYKSVMKMSPRDRLNYFLNRPEVKRELYKGDARAVLIPLRETGIGWYSGKADNLLLVRVSRSVMTGSEAVKALNKSGDAGHGDVFVRFSSFMQAVSPNAADEFMAKRIRPQAERIRAQEERIRGQEKRILAREEQIRTQEERIRAEWPQILEKRIKICDEEIRALEERVRSQEERVREQEKCVREQTERLQPLEQALKDRMCQLEGQIRQLEELDEQIQLLEMLPQEEIDKRILAYEEQLQDVLGYSSRNPKRIRRRLRIKLTQLREPPPDMSRQLQSEREKLESELRKLASERGKQESDRSKLESECSKRDAGWDIEMELEHNSELRSGRSKLESERKELELARSILESECKKLESIREQYEFAVQCLRKGEMIPSKYNVETLPVPLYMALQSLEEHGEIADLRMSDGESDSCVLGITDKLERTIDPGLYVNVMKMSPRDRFAYFLNRPEVRRELYQGDARAVIIPFQAARWKYVSVENYVLVRVSSSLKTGAEIVAALKRSPADGVLVQFSPFECAVSPEYVDVDGSISTLENKILTLEKRMAAKWLDSDRDELEPLVKELKLRLNGGEMIPSVCAFSDIYKNHYHVQGARKRVFQTIEEHGDISDLIVSSDESGSYVFGICFVNIYGSSARTKYGGPQDYGDRFPKYVKAPDGTVLYELTDETVRKQFENWRKQQFENWRKPHAKYAGPRIRDVDDVDF